MENKKSAAADFYSAFKQETAGIKERIQSVNDMQSIDSIRQEIRSMELRIADASVFLPQYDQRVHMQTIRELSEELNATQSRVMPKGKFSFKSRKAKNSVAAVAGAGNTPATVQLSAGLEDKKADITTDDNTFTIDAISNTNYRLLTSQLSQLSADILIKNCSNATIDLRIPSDTLDNTTTNTTTPLISTVHIVDCKKCTIVFSQAIGGSLFVERCNDLQVAIACQQLRVHSSSAVDFYLHVSSDPIIEDCKEMQFAPFEVTGMNGPEWENLYANVKDFYWLKSQQSPNWRLMPTELHKDWKSILSE